MKLIVALTALSLTPTLVLAGNKEDKEALSQVSRIFVSGDGTAAQKAREYIARPNSCFALTNQREGSDAVLYLTAPAERDGGLIRASQSVQGELKKDGGTIWQNDSSIPDFPNHQAAVGLAAVSLVNALEHNAGCGKKKGTLARGSK